MNRWRETAGVAALLVALTALLTWPLAARLPTAVTNLADPLHFSWVLAWDLHALATDPLRVFHANIFHPHRWALAYSEHLLGFVPLAAPVRLAGGGPILAHNVVLFASFPLVGLAMFWLVRHLTGHVGAAAVAALLYAFSHYRFGHLSHINLLGHQWVPLMLLGLHLAVASGARWRDVTLATGAFVLQALSSGYYGAFSVVALAVFVLWVAAPAGRPPLGRLVLRGLIAGAVGTLVLTPTVVPYYLVRRESGLVRELAETQLYSARLTSYLATPPGNLWFGAPTERFRRPEGELFPGAVMLGLAAIGIGAAWGRRGSTPAVGGPDRAAPAHPRVWPRWLDVVLAAYLVLTLANVLVLGGGGVTLGPIRVSQRHFERAALVVVAVLALRRLINRRAVPLVGLGWVRQLAWPNAAGHYVVLVVVAGLCSFGPTLFVDDTPVARPLYHQFNKRVPGFDAIRVPARFAMLVSTGLAVLAGYGVAALAAPRRRWAVRVTAVVALGGLAVLEAWAVPLSLREPPQTPGAADRWLAAEPSPGAVAVLPMFGQVHGEAPRLLGSTSHWRPLVNGYASFFPPGYWQTVETLNRFPAPEALARLRALGARYVVIYLEGFPPETRAFLRECDPAGLRRVAAFDGIVIFEVAPPP